MMEMALVHSHNYLARADFQTESNSDKLFLKKGDMFVIYQKPGTRTKSHNDEVILPSIIIETMRMELTELWNRIAQFKGWSVPCETYGRQLKPPNYVRHLFQMRVWQIDKTDQVKIKRHMKKTKNPSEEP